MSRSRRFSNPEPGSNGGLTRFVPWPAGSRQAKGRIDASAILESLDYAVIGRRSDGTISTWDAGAVRLYGYSAAEVAGKRITFLPS